MLAAELLDDINTSSSPNKDIVKTDTHEVDAGSATSNNVIDATPEVSGFIFGLYCAIITEYVWPAFNTVPIIVEILLIQSLIFSSKATYHQVWCIRQLETVQSYLCNTLQP